MGDETTGMGYTFSIYKGAGKKETEIGYLSWLRKGDKGASSGLCLPFSPLLGVLFYFGRYDQKGKGRGFYVSRQSGPDIKEYSYATTGSFTGN